MKQACMCFFLFFIRPWLNSKCDSRTSTLFQEENSLAYLQNYEMAILCVLNLQNQEANLQNYQNTMLCELWCEHQETKQKPVPGFFLLFFSLTIVIIPNHHFRAVSSTGRQDKCIIFFKPFIFLIIIVTVVFVC